VPSQVHGHVLTLNRSQSRENLARDDALSDVDAIYKKHVLGLQQDFPIDLHGCESVESIEDEYTLRPGGYAGCIESCLVRP
jgi:hypothetical protein